MPSSVVVGPLQKAGAQPFADYFEGLLKTSEFLTSPRRNELLRYLVDRSLSGQGQTLSEYAIALEVFRKPESFDPRIDSTVRSEISRLRKSVLTYYQGPGAADPWRIVFPTRGYVPQVSQVEQAEPVPEIAPAFSTLNRATLVFFCAATTVIVVFAAGILRWKHRAAHVPTSSARLENTTGHNPQGVNPEAQALYLKGEYYWEHRTAGSLNAAIDAYTQAIVADSDYAQAYAGLAASYDLMPEFSAAPQKEAFQRAIAAANKAISLDPSLAIAHRALAFGLFWSQTDIPRALNEFQEAIRLAPGDAEAHHWYATALNSLMRTKEARSEIDLAQQLDPASRSILADKAWIRYLGGDPQGAAKLRELEAAEPDFRSPPEYLARIDLAQGNYVDYLDQLHRLARISQKPLELKLCEAAQKGWDSSGSIGMLNAMKGVQEEEFAGNRSDGYDLAHTYALLGEKQQAIKSLQAALAAKDVFVLDTLRPDWAPQMNGYPPFEKIQAQIRTLFGIANI